MSIRKLITLTMLLTVALGASDCRPSTGVERARPAGTPRPAEEARPAARPRPIDATLAAKLQGVWVPDFDETVAHDPDLARLDDATKQKLAAMFARMTIRIGATTLEMTDAEGRIETETYVLRSSEGRAFVLESRDSKGKLSTETLELVTDDRLVVTKPGEKDRVYLKRAR